jgi:hypothetical protein
MVLRILFASLLVVITVTIHSLGLALILRLLWHRPPSRNPRLLRITWLFVRIINWVLAVHILEIALWGLFFWWQKCFPDARSSFYFSGVTYTTIGYGDLVLPKEWQMFGPLEGQIGILMCGASTAFLFAALSTRYIRHY